MTPRGLLTTIGATALGFGLIIGGAPAIPDVFAQEATPPAAEAPAQIAQEQRIDFEAQRAEAYDSFVAALASELGTDESAVDAAIRTALTQQVDEREAAGEIDVGAGRGDAGRDRSIRGATLPRVRWPRRNAWFRRPRRTARTRRPRRR